MTSRNESRNTLFVIVDNTMFEAFSCQHGLEVTLQRDKAFSTDDFDHARFIMRQIKIAKPEADVRIHSACRHLGPRVVVGSDHNFYIV